MSVVSIILLTSHEWGNLGVRDSGNTPHVVQVPKQPFLKKMTWLGYMYTYSCACIRLYLYIHVHVYLCVSQVHAVLLNKTLIIY